MKNLKRVLSLALTGVMLVGMMAIGASAANKDFTDKDEIVHTEAVSVMSSLGVLQGKDTGAFDPKATVTRGEMAKIICVMLNGGVDPTLGTAGAAMFSDTATHWARNYIEYCASMGIIAGMGDGTFGPDLPVTGGAAAKMLLVALGYDSDIFGFTGADWEINVNRIANTEAKLYEEIKSIDTSAGLSRDDTAQMAYNALEARLMVQGYDKVVSSGEISYNYGLGDQTFLNKYFDAKVFIGTFTGNDKTNTTTITAQKGEIVVNGRLDTDPEYVVTNGQVTTTKNRREAAFPSDLDITNIGEEVKVIFKDAKGGTGNRPDKYDTIYGVFLTGNTQVINATMADVKDLQSSEQKIKIGDTKYAVADEVWVSENYRTSVKYDKTTNNQKVVGTDETAPGADDATNSDLTDDLKATTGDPIKFIVNEDGEIERAYIVKSVLAVVTSKNATKISINDATVGTITIADHEVADDLKVDDIVVATVLYQANARTDGAYVIIEKAEKVTGEVSGYKTTTKNNVTSYENVSLDGTAYKIWGKAALLESGIEDSVDVFENDDIGDDFDLYMVNGYVRAAVRVSEAASNYSVITDVKGGGETGSVFQALQVQVMDATGTKTILTVSKDSDDTVTTGNSANKIDATDYPVGSIVTYTMNKDNEAVLSMKAIKDSNTAASEVKYLKSNKTFNGDVTTSDCVLFATNGSGSYKAYNIRNLNDFTTNDGAAQSPNAVTWRSYAPDGKVVAVVAELGRVPGGATSTTVYGIVSAASGTTKVDGTVYGTYTIDVNDTKYTAYTNGTYAVGDVVAFDPTSDNTYGNTDIVKLATAQGTLPTTGGGKVAVGYVDSYDKNDAILSVFTSIYKDVASNSFKGKDDTSTTYAVDEKVAIYYVDQDNDEGVASGSIAKFDAVNGKANVVVIYEENANTGVKTAIAIIVEVSTEENIIGSGSVVAAPACQHQMSKTDGTPATCSAPGTVDTWTCSKCNKTFIDENGTTEATDQNKVDPIDPSSHSDAGTWTLADADDVTAAGDNPGFTAGQHVKLCGDCHKAIGAAHNADVDTAECTVCHP